MSESDTPAQVGSNDGLGVAPTCRTNVYGDLWNAAAVREMLAAERERCAKLCDEVASEMQQQKEGGWSVAEHCAREILKA